MTLYRKILSHTAIYAAGILLGKLASFLLLPLYTRYLTPSDYGVLELVDLAFIVAGTAGLRLGEAFFYFYFRADSDEGRARVLSTAVIGAAAIGAGAAVVFWLLAGMASLLVFQTGGYASYFRLMFAALAFSFVQDVGFCYLRARSRAGLYVWLQTGKLVLTLMLNVPLLVWYRMGIPAMLWSAVAANGVTAAVLAVYCLARIRVVFDFRMARRFCEYGAPVALSSLGLLFMHYADRLFLQRCASLAEVGVYSLGYKIGMLTAYIWAAFSMFWNAQMFVIVEARNGDFVYVRAFTYITGALTFGALVLGIFARPLVQVMAAPAYAHAAVFVAPIAAAYLIKGIDDFFRSAFLLEKRTGRSARVTMAGVAICFVAYAALVPRFRSLGAVVATLVSFSCMTALSWYEAQKVRAFPFEYGRLAHLILCAVAVFAAWSAVRPETLGFEILMGSVFVLLFPALLWATRFCDERETAFVKVRFSRFAMTTPNTIQRTAT